MKINIDSSKPQWSSAANKFSINLKYDAISKLTRQTINIIYKKIPTIAQLIIIMLQIYVLNAHDLFNFLLHAKKQAREYQHA